MCHLFLCMENLEFLFLIYIRTFLIVSHSDGILWVCMSKPNEISIKQHTCNSPCILGASEMQFEWPKKAKLSRIYLCSKLLLPQKQSEHLIQRNPFFASQSHQPPPPTKGLRPEQQRGLSYPNSSSGTGGWKQPCFCSLLWLRWSWTVPHGEAGRLLSIIPTSVTAPSPPRPMPLVEPSQPVLWNLARMGGSMCLNEQAPWHSRSLGNFLREVEIQIRRIIGTRRANEFIIWHHVGLSSDKPQRCYCVLRFEILSPQRRTCEKLSNYFDALSKCDNRWGLFGASGPGTGTGFMSVSQRMQVDCI